MIISSEHHDLFEAFKKAHEDEAKLAQKLESHTVSPEATKESVIRLFREYEEAHTAKMELYGQLKKTEIDKGA